MSTNSNNQITRFLPRSSAYHYRHLWQLVRNQESVNTDGDLLQSCSMFARRIKIEYEVKGERRRCEMRWLDSFAMRNFTNATAFDDTLPIADGLMEIGTHVEISSLTAAMQDWFRRKNYIPAGTQLIVTSA